MLNWDFIVSLYFAGAFFAFFYVGGWAWKRKSYLGVSHFDALCLTLFFTALWPILLAAKLAFRD